MISKSQVGQAMKRIKRFYTIINNGQYYKLEELAEANQDTSNILEFIRMVREVAHNIGNDKLTVPLDMIADEVQREYAQAIRGDSDG